MITIFKSNDGPKMQEKCLKFIKRMSKIKPKGYWEEDFNSKTEEHEGIFGHNTDIPKSFFKKLHKLSPNILIKFVDYYSAIISLPDLDHERANVLMFLLTEGPLPTLCRYQKKNDKLFVEWHY